MKPNPSAARAALATIAAALIASLAAIVLAVWPPSAHAQDAAPTVPAQAASTDPAVAAAASANQAISQCITAVTQGASAADNSVKALLITQAPAMCRQSVVVAQPQAKQSDLATVGHYTLGVLQILAGIKDKTLMWQGISTLAGRGFDAAENLGSQGISAASKPPAIVITNTTEDGASVIYPATPAGALPGTP